MDELSEKIAEVENFLKSRKDLSGYDILDVRKQAEQKYHRAVIRGKLGGQDITVRYVLKVNPGDYINFANEISILRALESVGSSHQPRVLDCSAEKLWIIQTLVPGDKAGTSFKFTQDFIDKIDPAKLVPIFDAFFAAKPSLTERPYKAFDFYNKRYDHFKAEWPNNDFTVLDKWKSFANSNLEGYLKENIGLSHADMNPGNIIYQDDKVTGIIDWELSCYDSRWRDFADVYVCSILYPEWQKRFVEKLNIAAKELPFFHFYVFYYLADTICNLNIMIKNDKSEIYRSGHMTKDEISHLLEACLAELEKIKL
ncbi:MAG: phosphotransferase [Candidatus Berkelbacteria bacterium]